MGENVADGAGGLGRGRGPESGWAAGPHPPLWVTLGALGIVTGSAPRISPLLHAGPTASDNAPPIASVGYR